MTASQSLRASAMIIIRVGNKPTVVCVITSHALAMIDLLLEDEMTTISALEMIWSNAEYSVASG